MDNGGPAEWQRRDGASSQQAGVDADLLRAELAEQGCEPFWRQAKHRR